MKKLETKSPYQLLDAHGHFGPYGGRFVAKTLMQPLEELRLAYERYRNDAQFCAELDFYLKHFVGPRAVKILGYSNRDT